MLVTGAELLRVEPDGSRVRHADLRAISPYGWSEITVDGRGNVYVNSLNFDFADFGEVLASGRRRARSRSSRPMARPARSRTAWRSRTGWP